MIPTWSVTSSGQRSWRTTLVAPSSACDRVRRDHLVVPGRHDRVGGRRRRLGRGVELAHERRAGGLLGARRAEQARARGASGFVVPWLDGARPTMSSITAELVAELGHVAAEHPALRVADERHRRRAGARAHLVDERGQLVGRLVDRRHPAAHEVEREHAVARGLQRRRDEVPRDRHVAERAVHEDHRRRRRAAGEVVGAGRRHAGRLRARRARRPPAGRPSRARRRALVIGGQGFTPEPAVRRLRAAVRAPSAKRSGSGAAAERGGHPLGHRRAVLEAVAGAAAEQPHARRARGGGRR